MALEPLFDDLRARKPEAIASVVRLYAGDLLRIALGHGLAPADAEEAVQTAFATFLDAVARFEGRSSIKTFLVGILYKKILETGRRKRELPAPPGDEVFEARFNAFGHWSPGPRGPEESTSDAELARLISECLEALPQKERAAFCLKEMEGQENPAICNILDVGSTHLRVLLFRARSRLRACIEGKWGS